ncbi:MAG: PIN domain-containing protein [Rhodospirillales bacterium]|nr:PIN domain-containing protein [Rhodospirillales bacterium]
MIAVDTSTLIAYLAGDRGHDVEALDLALAHNQARLPPVVVTEMLSAANAPEHVARLLLALPILDIGDGYWERCGQLRRRLHAHGLNAPLADTLICQSCLDHDLPLLTRDRDFRHFAKHGNLTLG